MILFWSWDRRLVSIGEIIDDTVKLNEFGMIDDEEWRKSLYLISQPEPLVFRKFTCPPVNYFYDFDTCLPNIEFFKIFYLYEILSFGLNELLING